MNVASEPAHSSLAQRIARVWNCMHVEVATGISVTDKDLFMSLCQMYEQNSVETSRTASASPQNTLDQAFSFSSLAPGGILPDESARIPGRDTDTPSGQYRVGFSIIRWPNLADDEDFDDWDDWNKKG